MLFPSCDPSVIDLSDFTDSGFGGVVEGFVCNFTDVSFGGCVGRFVGFVVMKVGSGVKYSVGVHDGDC